MKRQEFELINKPDIIIATPGRLIDILLNSKSIVLNSIEVLVLDEADKLLEMGFRPLIEEILKHIKRESEIENRQTLLLSATLTSGIQELAQLALTAPVTVSEENQQNSVNSNLKLTHFFIRLPEKHKQID